MRALREASAAEPHGFSVQPERTAAVTRVRGAVVRALAGLQARAAEPPEPEAAAPTAAATDLWRSTPPWEERRDAGVVPPAVPQRHAPPSLPPDIVLLEVNCAAPREVSAAVCADSMARVVCCTVAADAVGLSACVAVLLLDDSDVVAGAADHVTPLPPAHALQTLLRAHGLRVVAVGGQDWRLLECKAHAGDDGLLATLLVPALAAAVAT